jgi:hypothetical protein
MKEETMDFEYIVGEDFDRAWLNFELDLPLKPREEGEPNPFYVDRPHNPLGELEDNLLAPFFKPPKFFFSGHRGCGKSTELLRLGANPQIREKYLPVHFTIRDEADINDLDFRDVLLSMAGQIYRTYHEKGGTLPKQMEAKSLMPFGIRRSSCPTSNCIQATVIRFSPSAKQGIFESVYGS